jgi:hypothetical protein
MTRGAMISQPYLNGWHEVDLAVVGVVVVVPTTGLITYVLEPPDAGSHD